VQPMKREKTRRPTRLRRKLPSIRTRIQPP
jgi:hypothetical protein